MEVRHHIHKHFHDSDTTILYLLQEIYVAISGAKLHGSVEGDCDGCLCDRLGNEKPNCKVSLPTMWIMLFLIVHRFHITIIKAACEMNLTSSGWKCVKMPLLIPVAFLAWLVSSLTLLLHHLHPSAPAVKVVETMPSTRYSAAAPQALRLLPRQLDYR
jgi:hypothetical protein